MTTQYRVTLRIRNLERADSRHRICRQQPSSAWRAKNAMIHADVAIQSATEAPSDWPWKRKRDELAWMLMRIAWITQASADPIRFRE
jgi:hypothetical protein